MLSIRQLGARFGLSRATLLYYERIGLLRPAGRTVAGYRRYSEAEASRLAEICRYRAAGMAVSEIGAMLAQERPGVAGALERRLEELNREIAGLRRQQQVVLDLLGTAQRPSRVMTKARWVALLRSAGMTDADCTAWHRAFERQSPEAHQDFLESLGISPEEIRRIREYSGGTAVSAPTPVPPRRRAPHQRRAERNREAYSPASDRPPRRSR